jgi:hypothetical protein
VELSGAAADLHWLQGDEIAAEPREVGLVALARLPLAFEERVGLRQN